MTYKKSARYISSKDIQLMKIFCLPLNYEIFEVSDSRQAFKNLSGISKFK